MQNKDKKLKKLKTKIIIIYTIVFFSFLIFLFFFSEYLYLMVSNEEISLYKFLPHTIIVSMVQNKLHLVIFLSNMLLIALFLISNLNSKDSFKSEMDTITDTIETPKKIGQSQHGSAKWMKPEEYDKVFSSYKVDPNANKFVKSLIESGESDIKKLKENDNKKEDIPKDIKEVTK